MSTLPEPEWETTWAGARIRVFATGDSSPFSLRDAAAVLSAEEHQRAARFHFQRDRERWMRSRALLRRVLAERTGIAAHQIAFETGEFGKPALRGREAAGTPWHFNLSHSGDFAAIAVSDHPVGVDIECWKPLPAEELAAFAFRPEEREALQTHADPPWYFLKLWTAKEAVMKCTGQGLSIPPDRVVITSAVSGDCEAHIADTQRTFRILCPPHPETWMLAAAHAA